MVVQQLFFCLTTHYGTPQKNSSCPESEGSLCLKCCLERALRVKNKSAFAALFFSARKSCGSMSAFSSVSGLTNVTDQRARCSGDAASVALALADPAQNSPLTAAPTQASPHPRFALLTPRVCRPRRGSRALSCSERSAKHPGFE